MEDIFELQDHITEAVVGAIEPSLKRAEIARATAKPTERLDAYDLYLRAWPYYNASGCEASDRAIALLRRALEIDPTYMRAKALLASAYATREAQAIRFAVATGRWELHWRAKSLKWILTIPKRCVVPGSQSHNCRVISCRLHGTQSGTAFAPQFCSGSESAGVGALPRQRS